MKRKNVLYKLMARRYHRSSLVNLPKASQPVFQLICLHIICRTLTDVTGIRSSSVIEQTRLPSVLFCSLRFGDQRFAVRRCGGDATGSSQASYGSHGESSLLQAVCSCSLSTHKRGYHGKAFLSKFDETQK